MGGKYWYGFTNSQSIKGQFKVYALDLPGFGESQLPKEVFDSADYARIVKKFIDMMGIEGHILIGHSFGGKLSILLANKYPSMVEKMVLINSWPNTQKGNRLLFKGLHF